MLKVKKVKPLFDRIITTANKYGEVIKNGIIDANRTDAIKEYQTVIAVGPMVRDVKAGDVVIINPKRYAVMKHKEGSLKDGVITDNPVVGYNFETIELDGSNCLVLYNNDIEYILEDFEDVEDSNIIVDSKPKIIS